MDTLKSGQQFNNCLNAKLCLEVRNVCQTTCSKHLPVLPTHGFNARERLKQPMPLGQGISRYFLVYLEALQDYTTSVLQSWWLVSKHLFICWPLFSLKSIF